MRKLITLLLYALPFIAHANLANTYKVLFYHQANPPYSFIQGDKQAGIFADIFAEISALTGLKFEFLSLSVARGQMYFNQGKVDIEPGINPIWRSKQQVQGLYSQSYAYSEEVILARTGQFTHDPTLFYDEIVGKVRGYYYGEFEQHFGKDKIIVFDNISERILIEQLYKKRFDYIIMGKATASYYALSNPNYANFKIVYEISKLPVAMRVHPTQAHLLKPINSALEIMIKTGSIKKIYKKYAYHSSLNSNTDQN